MDSRRSLLRLPAACAGHSSRARSADSSGRRQVAARCRQRDLPERRLRERPPGLPEGLGRRPADYARRPSAIRRAEAAHRRARRRRRVQRRQRLSADGHQLARTDAGSGGSQDRRRPAAIRGPVPRHEGLRPGDGGAEPRPEHACTPGYLRQHGGGRRLQPHGADLPGTDQARGCHQPAEHFAGHPHAPGRAAGSIDGVRPGPAGRRPDHAARLR